MNYGNIGAITDSGIGTVPRDSNIKNMEPEDTPPGLAMGLDLGTLRGLLEKQSGTLMASSKQMLDGLMREIEGKWMSQLVELHERITAQNEVVRELTQRCESLEEELRKVEDERGVALVQSQDCGLADLEPRGRKKVRRKRAKGATMCRENNHQDEESSVFDGMDVRDHCRGRTWLRTLLKLQMVRLRQKIVVCVQVLGPRFSVTMVRSAALLLWRPRAAVGLLIWVRNNGTWNRHGWKAGWGRRWYGGHSSFGSWAYRCKHRQIHFSEEGWQHQWRSRERPGTMIHVWIQSAEPWGRRGHASVKNVSVYQEGPLFRLSLA